MKTLLFASLLLAGVAASAENYKPEFFDGYQVTCIRDGKVAAYSLQVMKNEDGTSTTMASATLVSLKNGRMDLKNRAEGTSVVKAEAAVGSADSKIASIDHMQGDAAILEIQKENADHSLSSSVRVQVGKQVFETKNARQDCVMAGVLGVEE